MVLPTSFYISYVLVKVRSIILQNSYIFEIEIISVNVYNRLTISEFKEAEALLIGKK